MTRDILKRKWEESFALADQLGPEQPQVLPKLLDRFQLDCHKLAEPAKEITNAGEFKKFETRGSAEYKGRQNRVKITHGKFCK